MKYKMVYTPSLIYVELESDADGWNFIKQVEANTWYMAHLDEEIASDNFVDFNTLNEEEFFQMQLVLDTHGYDMVLLRKVQKAVNEFIIQHNSSNIRMIHDLEVQ